MYTDNTLMAITGHSLMCAGPGSWEMKRSFGVFFTILLSARASYKEIFNTHVINLGWLLLHSPVDEITYIDERET